LEKEIKGGICEKNKHMRDCIFPCYLFPIQTEQLTALFATVAPNNPGRYSSTGTSSSASSLSSEEAPPLGTAAIIFTSAWLEADLATPKNERDWIPLLAAVNGALWNTDAATAVAVRRMDNDPPLNFIVCFVGFPDFLVSIAGC
jgi:hypothetical protein